MNNEKLYIRPLRAGQKDQHLYPSGMVEWYRLGVNPVAKGHLGPAFPKDISASKEIHNNNRRTRLSSEPEFLPASAADTPSNSSSDWVLSDPLLRSPSNLMLDEARPSAINTHFLKFVA